MGRPSLLLAESDPRTLGILELGLRKAGYAVRTARDGEEALAALRAGAPELFICDLTLPRKDGLALARAVREDEKLSGIPLLMLCPDESASVKARVIEAGADDVLGRPVHVQELAQRVALLLERRKQARAGGPAPLQGRISDLGLLDLFTSLEDGRRSAVVQCEAPGQVARVWVREGQVVDAELGPLSGNEAFWRLMTWGSGTYRIDFGEVDRAPQIEGGTQGGLAEALRRVDELVRSAESLPLGSRLRVDLDVLAEKLGDLPDEVNAVLRCFDGHRTLREAMDLTPLDDLSALSVVRRLMGEGILREADGGPQRPSLQQWLSDPPTLRSGPAQAGAAKAAAAGDTRAPQPARALSTASEAAGSGAEAPPGLVHFPPVRGVRRERLRREAEEVKGRIASGQPVLLTHAVELPPFLADGADELGPSRFLSDAVGEAARKFAPDTPVARVMPPRLRDQVSKGGPDPRSRTPDAPAVADVTAPASDAVPSRIGPKWKKTALAAALVATAIVLVALSAQRVRTNRGTAIGAQAPSAAEESAIETSPHAVPQAPGVSPGSKGDAGAYAKAMEQGEALRSKARYKAAVAAFKRAVELRPTSQPALLALGNAFLEADMPKSAVEPLEAAALLDAKNGQAQLLLGTAYQSLGRNADAVSAYQRYLALEPQGRFSRDVQVILANLQKQR